MELVNPNSIFKGTVLVAAPHMDDGVLACGGTIAQLSNKGCVFFVYATDGSRSPVPMFRRQGSASPDLVAIREQEARAALSILGIPQSNIHFLGLPDGRLRTYRHQLTRLLAELTQQIAPDHILMPFRYDRHPDHLALNRVMTQVLDIERNRPSLAEYFVYYRWQLLPGKDIRMHIRPDHLVAIDILAHSSTKKEALLCFKSQTTCFYDWQDRPILPSRRLDETSHTPEFFLRHDPAYLGDRVFAGARHWIRLIHYAEPRLKKGKEQALALAKMVRPANGST